MGHLAAAMENHGLHFVALTQKLDDLVLADLIIVLGGSRPELHFLELRALLVLALLVRFLVRLIEIFPVIGDFADWLILFSCAFHHFPSPPARRALVF